MLSRIVAFVGVSCLVCAVAGAAVWETDFAKAKAQATAKQKFMLVAFTGSDWCPYCMKLDKEVFSQPEFKKYAAENLVCVSIDTPHGKKLSAKLAKQNKALKDKYEARGNPMVLLLAPDGKEAARIPGYQPGGAAKYVENLRTLLAPHQDQLTPVPEPKKPGSKVPDQPPPVSAEDVHNAVDNAL